MKIKDRKKAEIIFYVITIFILGLIFGRLLIEQVKLNEAQKKIDNIEIKYNELNSEYEALRAKYKNEIN